MRTVNLKQFQRNMYDEIRDLPVMVVKKKSRHDTDGTPVFVVYPYEPPKPKRGLLERIFDDRD